MEMANIRAMDATELGTEGEKISEQLFRIRFAKGLGKQDGVSKIRSMKKDVARIQTVLRERSLAAGKAGK